MRWPLRNQILARLLALLLITVAGLTYANIRSAIRSTRIAEQQQLNRVIRLMKSTRFPLTGTVLQNMQSLSGAEFILVDADNQIVSSTDNAPRDWLNSEPSPGTAGKPLFYHESIQQIRTPTIAEGELHIFVPRQSDRQVWWQASRSPITIAAIVLPIALLVGLALANQVTRPLSRLERQVQQIADGDVNQVPINRVNDEIKDLANSVNEMACRLLEQEDELRKNERLNTMVQFGKSIAHHLRNSATGCQLAVELLANEQSDVSDSEYFQVALRQLGLMNNYIKKFLLLSKSPERLNDSNESTNLADVLDNVVFLIGPAARHLNVELETKTESDDSLVSMGKDDAEQLTMNLLTNAITAVGQISSKSSAVRPRVHAELNVDRGQFTFKVTDNGPGPPEDIADKILLPFVTGSKEGTGLGLSLVNEIAHRMGGEIRWYRKLDSTVFEFHSQKPGV